MDNPTAEIATLKETVRTLNREIRDLKRAHSESDRARTAEMKALTDEIEAMHRAVLPIMSIAPRLEKLLTEADRQDGFKSAAKLMLGGGLIGTLAAVLAGVWEFFAKGAG
jgi:chromosome segregation ATPase